MEKGVYIYSVPVVISLKQDLSNVHDYRNNLIGGVGDE